MKLLNVAASALLAGSVLADNAKNLTGEWHPRCHECDHTVTKKYTIVLPAETVCGTSTKLVLRTTTGDGVVRYTGTTAFISQPTTVTTTVFSTSYNKVTTTTKTIVKTTVVPKPRHWLPADDTIHGWPKEYSKRDEAADVEALNIEEDKDIEKRELDWSPERAKKEHYPEHGCEKPCAETCTVTKTVTVTPRPITSIVAHRTITRTTRYIPTTISVTQKTTQTTHPVSRLTVSRLISADKTVTATKTSTFTYYAACATNNLISHGPDGHTITNVYNDGFKFSSTYDAAPGTYKSPYECCAACMESETCSGSVFRTGQNFCLLLHRKDRTCDGQCEHWANYVTDPKNKQAGLVVSNGRCGFQQYYGNAKPGVPMVGDKVGAKGRQPGL